MIITKQKTIYRKINTIIILGTKGKLLTITMGLRTLDTSYTEINFTDFSTY